MLYITLNAIDDHKTLLFVVTGREIKNYRTYVQAYDEYRRVFYPMAYLLQNISYGNDVSDKFAALKKNSTAKSLEPADRPVKLSKSSDAAYFCPKCGDKLDAIHLSAENAEIKYHKATSKNPVFLVER